MGNCFLYKRGGGSGGSVPEIIKAALGKIIFLSDSKNAKLKGLRVFGKTIQDGTPSPDAPIPMESVGDGGAVNVVAAGKNLWNLGDEVTVNVWINKAELYLPKGTYTLSGIVTNDDTSRNSASVALFNKDGTRVVWINMLKSTGGERRSVTFEVAEDCQYITVYAYSQYTDGSSAVYKDMQIEYGTTATDYEPYKAIQTLPISTPNGLPGIPVVSGGNYTDGNGQQWICDEVDLGRGVYVQRIDPFVFTGNETIYSSGKVGSLGFYCFVAGRDVAGTANTKSMCNYFRTRELTIQASDGNSEQNTNIVSGSVGNFYPRMCIGHSVLGTTANSTEPECMAAVKAWLKARYNEGKPLMVYSQLETPIETPLSAEELAAYAAMHTNYPSTTIYNDADAYMEVKYTAIGG